VTSGRRLLSISHSYVVGTNRALPNALARLGWDVTVVAPDRFPGDLREIALEPVEGEAARVRPVTLTHAPRIHFMQWRSTLREILAEPWDVVHVWEEPYVLAGAQVARWRTGGRLVYATFQNLSKRYPPPLNWFERYSLARADAWIAFGHTIEATLEQRRGWRALPHRVIPPAIDLERFTASDRDRDSARGELGFGPDDCVVGFAGRFVPEKGHATLTAALDRIEAPWRALIVGGGADQPALQAWASRHGGRVKLLTDVGHAVMPRYLNAMDVLALPSRTTRRWREQFGRVIAEAMACGVAVAGSDSGEIPYVVGDAGVIVPEDAGLAGWVQALDGLVRSPARRRELAARGRAHAQEFGVGAVARRHAAFFEELLA